MTETITFYTTKDAHGWMSNFARYPVFFDGRTWPTSEHAYQAMKATDYEVQEVIRDARDRAGPSPKLAAAIGRSLPSKYFDREKWEREKVTVMGAIVESKLRQHPELVQKLLATEDAYIAEDSEDAVWGWGRDHKGKNHLGHILMDLRAKLREEQSGGS